MTKVGAFLRAQPRRAAAVLERTHRDMSLVGPRPLPADQVAANLELLGPRHEVPAGVTGWWQVNGRSGVTPEEAVRPGPVLHRELVVVAGPLHRA